MAPKQSPRQNGDKLTIDTSAGTDLRLRLVGLEDHPVQYASILHANHDPNAFQMIFSLLVPPVILDEEDRNRLIQTGLQAQVVSRIVVTPRVARDILEVLVDQIAKYEESFGPISGIAQSSQSDKEV